MSLRVIRTCIWHKGCYNVLMSSGGSLFEFVSYACKGWAETPQLYTAFMVSFSGAAHAIIYV